MFYNQSQSRGIIFEVLQSVYKQFFQTDFSFDTLTDEDIDEHLFLVFSGALEGDRRCIELATRLHRHFRFDTTDLEIDDPNIGIRDRQPYVSPNKNSECSIMGIDLYSRCAHTECPFWDDEKPFNCRASEKLTSRDISNILNLPEAIVNREGDEGIRKVKRRFLEVFVKTEIDQEFMFLPVSEFCVLCAASLEGRRTQKINGHPICRSCISHQGVAAELEVRHCIRASKILKEIAQRFSNARNVMDAIGISTSTVDRLYSRYGLNKRVLFTQNTSSGVRSTTAKRPGRQIKLHQSLAKMTRYEMDFSRDGGTIEPDTRDIVAELYADASKILSLPIPPDLITAKISATHV